MSYVKRAGVNIVHHRESYRESGRILLMDEETIQYFLRNRRIARGSI